jgi:hypothetical protein
MNAPVFSGVALLPFPSAPPVGGGGTPPLAGSLSRRSPQRSGGISWTGCQWRHAARTDGCQRREGQHPSRWWVLEVGRARDDSTYPGAAPEPSMIQSVACTRHINNL